MASPVWGLRPTRLALRLDQAADAGDYEDAVLLGFLDGGIRQQVQEGRDLLVGQFQFLGHKPSQGGLGQSSSHSVFSFGAYPGVRRCCLGFLRKVRTAWRECDRGNACTKPLHSCGFGEPCRSLQCGFGAAEVNGKTAISTNFLGICAIFA
jgi:hypothetical protein